MILTEEKTDPDDSTASTLSSSSSRWSPSHNSPYPSQSLSSRTTFSQASGPSNSKLQPPSPLAWPPSASESALPLPHPDYGPNTSHTRAHSHSAVYLPPTPTVSGPVQPASFTRPWNTALKATTFAPIFLLADANSLRRGFPLVPPPSAQTPHPFLLHDVSERDWKEFLDELRTVANLTMRDRQNAYAVPILSALPLINIAVASAIKHHIRSKKPALVSLWVDKWNHHFFHPRSLEVILMRGQTRLSGQSDKPIAGLHTPRTVNFTAPPVDAGEGAGGDKDRDKEKTYRLFVVSMVG
ncbi:hypothetical protein C8F01DRAFT_1013106 [Mycena amicta]|nr:hypothetical protein C8F01DRAFT_1013106 [Mycena amicta]